MAAQLWHQICMELFTPAARNIALALTDTVQTRQVAAACMQQLNRCTKYMQLTSALPVQMRKPDQRLTLMRHCTAKASGC